jgi:PII-like signaling protein
MANGYSLRFYMHENARHGGTLLYDWLLDQAKRRGLHGGSAFLAVAGFGRHGVLHEHLFFEVQSELPVMVEFLVNEEDARKILDLVHQEGAQLFWTKSPMEFGILGQEDPAMSRADSSLRQPSLP